MSLISSYYLTRITYGAAFGGILLGAPEARAQRSNPDAPGGCAVSPLNSSVDLSDANRIPLALLQIPQLIVQMQGILQSAAWHFQVAPAFYLFDEGTSANAVALPNDPTRGRNAEVRYGARLLADDLHEFIVRQKHGVTIWEFGTEAIIGHEFAHIVQFQFPQGLPSEMTRDRELHADFLSGWFVARNAYGTPIRGEALNDGAQAFFARGSPEDAYFDPRSHGTQQERRESFLAGAAQFQQPLAVAFASATHYVRAHPSKQPVEAP